MKYIKDKPFYHRLVGEKSLFSRHPKTTLTDKTIISLQYPKDVGVGWLFTLFDTPKNFINYMALLETYQRCFFEVVLGEFPQKIYFDIDKLESEEQQLDFQNEIIEAIRIELEELGYDFDISRDLRVYSSHAPERKKFSLHIVLIGYAVYNHQENKEFFSRIQNRIPEKYKDMFDNSVYKPVQQFRTLYSTKCGEDRIKKLVPLIFYKGKAYKLGAEDKVKSKQLEINLKDSLIRQVTKCQFLPVLVKPKPKYEPSTVLTKEDARKAYDLFVEKQDLVTTYKGTWVNPRDLTGNLIVLSRVVPTFCKSCNRVHNNENPYLSIDDDKNVYFHCRRSNKRTLLGGISTSAIELNKYYYQKYNLGQVDLPTTKVSTAKTASSTEVSTVKKVLSTDVSTVKKRINSTTKLDIPTADFINQQLLFVHRLEKPKDSPTPISSKSQLWSDINLTGDEKIEPVDNPIWKDLEVDDKESEVIVDEKTNCKQKIWKNISYQDKEATVIKKNTAFKEQIWKGLGDKEEKIVKENPLKNIWDEL